MTVAQVEANETLEMASTRLMNTIARLEESLAEFNKERSALKSEAERLRSLCRGQAERISHLESDVARLQKQKSAFAMRLDGTIKQVERLTGSAA